MLHCEQPNREKRGGIGRLDFTYYINISTFSTVQCICMVKLESLENYRINFKCNQNDYTTKYRAKVREQCKARVHVNNIQ